MKDPKKELRDFFDKVPPGIVDMGCMKGEPIVAPEDRIVQVEFNYKKDTHPVYSVYYYHRIYNDDRVYKCHARFRRLPDIVRRFMSEHVKEVTPFGIKWSIAEKKAPLRERE